MGNDLGRTCGFSLQVAPPKKQHKWFKPFREAFVALDIDGDGKITREEFRTMLKKDPQIAKFLDVSAGASLTVIDKVFNNANHGSSISWENFIEYFGRVRPLRLSKIPELPPDVMEDLETAFDAIDKDGDGKISKKEFTKAFKKIPAIARMMKVKIPNATDKDTFEYLLNEIDADSTGNITWNEFLQYIAMRQTARSTLDIAQLMKDEKAQAAARVIQRAQRKRKAKALKIRFET